MVHEPGWWCRRRAFKEAFDSKPNVEVYDYLGANHGFNWFGYPPFHQQSAERALERSLAFLRKHIAWPELGISLVDHASDDQVFYFILR